MANIPLNMSGGFGQVASPPKQGLTLGQSPQQQQLGAPNNAYQGFLNQQQGQPDNYPAPPLPQQQLGGSLQQMGMAAGNTLGQQPQQLGTSLQQWLGQQPRQLGTSLPQWLGQQAQQPQQQGGILGALMPNNPYAQQIGQEDPRMQAMRNMQRMRFDGGYEF